MGDLYKFFVGETDPNLPPGLATPPPSGRELLLRALGGIVPPPGQMRVPRGPGGLALGALARFGSGFAGASAEEMARMRMDPVAREYRLFEAAMRGLPQSALRPAQAPIDQVAVPTIPSLSALAEPSSVERSMEASLPPVPKPPLGVSGIAGPSRQLSAMDLFLASKSPLYGNLIDPYRQTQQQYVEAQIPHVEAETERVKQTTAKEKGIMEATENLIRDIGPTLANRDQTAVRAAVIQARSGNLSSLVTLAVENLPIETQLRVSRGEQLTAQDMQSLGNLPQEARQKLLDLHQRHVESRRARSPQIGHRDQHPVIGPDGKSYVVTQEVTGIAQDGRPIWQTIGTAPRGATVDEVMAEDRREQLRTRNIRDKIGMNDRTAENLMNATAKSPEEIKARQAKLATLAQERKWLEDAAAYGGILNRDVAQEMLLQAAGGQANLDKAKVSKDSTALAAIKRRTAELARSHGFIKDPDGNPLFQ